MSSDSPIQLLDSPKVEVVRDEQGRFLSVYVKIREAKPVSAVQPDPDALVFFYLGRDDFPVGIKIAEPAPGIAFSHLAMRLLESPEGVPEGIDAVVVHKWFREPQQHLDYLRRLAEIDKEVVRTWRPDESVAGALVD